MKKVYIEDFCEDLNYRNVVLYIEDEIDLEELLDRFKTSNIGHLNRFDAVRENRLFYISNCDLQDVTITKTWNELYEIVTDDFSILQLKKDIVGFYIDVPG